MPIYEFECRQGHVTSDLFLASGRAPAEIQCPVCDSKAKRILSTDVAFVIPAYMKAQGSVGSTEDKSDEMVHYIRSDKFRKKREEIAEKGGEVKFGQDVKVDA